MSDSGWQVLDFSERGNVHVRKHEDGSEVDVPLAHAAVVIKEATFGGQSVSESPV